MNTPTVLQRPSPDVLQAIHHLNDLAFDEDCELFLHLGLLVVLATVIWFMNSKWSWQEIFGILDGPLLVLYEGLLPNYS